MRILSRAVVLPLLSFTSEPWRVAVGSLGRGSKFRVTSVWAAADKQQSHIRQATESNFFISGRCQVVTVCEKLACNDAWLI